MGYYNLRGTPPLTPYRAMSSQGLLFRHLCRPYCSNAVLSRPIRLPQNSTIKALYPTRCLATGRVVPRIVEPSMWTSLIPKFLRNRDLRGTQAVPRKSRGPNAATFFVVIFTLIGSQAIRMVMLRNEYRNYTRSADAKIRLLQEVIERLQKGEDVDVKRLLGTGNEMKEREWEEVLKEIEQEESLWHSKSRKTTHRGNPPKSEIEPPESGKKNGTTAYQQTSANDRPPTEQSKRQPPSNFY
ncbi:hypothetical protein ACO22_01742 [Paracoccidioides brasiliensis]|uniref:Uncharacterized protein n=1 Tax=Paracoccidioides brasiliensis TaxID=121759 RepID=A0A1D2JL08_PARBR|nr:hypothetical protein ACO22_01742 [Paracoccidioides brasiliensis]